MNKSLLATLASLGLISSAQASQQDDARFVDQLLNYRFNKEANIHLTILKEQYGESSSFYKIQKAKQLYFLGKADEAQALFLSVDKSDKLYKTMLNSLIEYSDQYKHSDALFQALKIYLDLPENTPAPTKQTVSIEYSDRLIRLFKLTEIRQPGSPLFKRVDMLIQKLGLVVGITEDDYLPTIKFLNEQEDIFKKDPKKVAKAKLNLLITRLEELQWAQKTSLYYNLLPQLTRCYLLLGENSKTITHALNTLPSYKKYEAILQKAYKKQGKKGWENISPTPNARYILALAYLQEAKKAQSENKLPIAQTYLMGGEIEKMKIIRNAAIQNLYVIIKKYPKHPIAPQAFLRFKEASTLLEAVAKKKPQLPEFDLFDIALSEYRLQHWDSAVTLLKDNIAQFNNKNERVPAETAGKSVRLLTTIFIKKGELDNAKAFISGIIDTPIGKESIDNDPIGSALLKLSTAYKKQGEDKKDARSTEIARALFKQYTSFSKSPRSLFAIAAQEGKKLRGKAENKTQLRKTIKAFKKVISEFPNSKQAASAQSQLAYYYSISKRYEDAITAYNKHFSTAQSLTFNHKLAKAKSLLGISNTCIQMKDEPKAKRALRRLDDFLKQAKLSPAGDAETKKLASFNDQVAFATLQSRSFPIVKLEESIKLKKAKSQTVSAEDNKKLLSGVDLFRQWLTKNERSAQAPYVLTRIIDIYKLEGSGNSLNLVEELEKELQAKYADSAIARSRVILILQVHLRNKDKAAAISEAKKIVSKAKAEPKSIPASNLRYVLGAFLYPYEPDKEDVPADIFKASSEIARDTAQVLLDHHSNSKNKASYQFKLGKASLFLKDFDNAEALFDEILADDEKSYLEIYISFARALIYEQTDQKEEAIKNLKKIASRARPQKRYDLTLQAGTKVAELLASSSEKAKVMEANTQALFAKDTRILDKEGKPVTMTEEQNLLLEKALYIYITTGARLGRNTDEEQKHFVDTYPTSRFLDAIKNADSISKDF